MRLFTPSHEDLVSKQHLAWTFTHCFSRIKADHLPSIYICLFAPAKYSKIVIHFLWQVNFYPISSRLKIKKKTALLRYNSCTIKSPNFKCAIQFFLHSQMCVTITTVNFMAFQSPQKEIPILSPKHQLTYFFYLHSFGYFGHFI